MLTHGTPSAAPDVRALVLNAGATTSSVAKGILSMGTGGTASASPDDTNLGLTLSPPAHHSQNRFQFLQGAVPQQGLGMIESPGKTAAVYLDMRLLSCSDAAQDATVMVMHRPQYTGSTWYSCST
jgi:hypothetical protein